MNIEILVFIVSCLLGALGFWIAKYRQYNRWIGFLIGIGCGVIVFLPFRTYKIAVLDLLLQHAISNDTIRKTKEIIIPGFPHAYNPSLISTEDGYLLSFRVKSHNFPTYLKKIGNVRTSYIGLVKLNRELEICEQPYLLDLISYSPNGLSSSAQDARLFSNYGSVRFSGSKSS